jgi:hypothetical protein
VGVGGYFGPRILTSHLNPQTLTDWPNRCNGRAIEGNENKKEVIEGRLGFPGP